MKGVRALWVLWSKMEHTVSHEPAALAAALSPPVLWMSERAGWGIVAKKPTSAARCLHVCS